jgi:hypothetical protein
LVVLDEKFTGAKYNPEHPHHYYWGHNSEETLRHRKEDFCPPSLATKALNLC